MLDLVDDSLTTLCGEVGCVIDCGHSVVVGEVVKQASFEETEYLIAVADDVGVAIEFLADIVRGEYLTFYVVSGESALLLVSEC
jgi:hypothetical protein